MLIQKIKNDIIKLLGGYTSKEYLRVEQKYQALLDSKTDNACTVITNEYIFRLLRDLVTYAKNELYGQSLECWTQKMYNILRNNMFRVFIRYVSLRSSAIYKLDTTLDGLDDFKHVIEQDNNQEALQIINEERFPNIK